MGLLPSILGMCLEEWDLHKLSSWYSLSSQNPSHCGTLDSSHSTCTEFQVFLCKQLICWSFLFFFFNFVCGEFGNFIWQLALSLALFPDVSEVTNTEFLILFVKVLQETDSKHIKRDWGRKLLWKISSRYYTGWEILLSLSANWRPGRVVSVHAPRAREMESICSFWSPMARRQKYQ